MILMHMILQWYACVDIEYAYFRRIYIYIYSYNIYIYKYTYIYIYIFNKSITRQDILTLDRDRFEDMLL